MKAFSLPRPNRRSGDFGRTFRLMLSWLVCVLLLPVPLPTTHRHEAIDVPHTLACHLEIYHADSHESDVAADETHWHFVFPTRGGDDRHDEDGLPDLPCDYVGADHVVVNASTPVNDLLCMTLYRIGYLSLPDPAQSLTVDPRLRHAHDAWRQHLIEASCVMRC